MVRRNTFVVPLWVVVGAILVLAVALGYTAYNKFSASSDLGLSLSPSTGEEDSSILNEYFSQIAES